MSTCCHAAIWKGRQGDNRRTRGGQRYNKTITRGGKREKTGQEDKRRTRSGDRLAAAAKPHTRRKNKKRTTDGQEEDNRRTTPGHGVYRRSRRLGPASFSRERTPTVELLGKGGWMGFHFDEAFDRETSGSDPTGPKPSFLSTMFWWSILFLGLFWSPGVLLQCALCLCNNSL